MKNQLEQMYRAAYGQFAVGAFNVFCAEQLQGIFLGAQRSQSPILVAITPAARRYLRPDILEGLVRGAARAFPGVAYSVHLDHGDHEHCLDAIQSGFYSSVMIDASRLAFEENVAATRAVVVEAHARGILVEAELGVLSGVEDHISVESRKARFTNPERAVEFVERTGCDSLAVAIGTSHGAYKFSGEARLEMEILDRIRQGLQGFPLVLHGASAVPQEEVQRINEAGGRLMLGASGVPEEQIRQAVELGVCKINIATDMRLMWARVHREFFLQYPDQFDLTAPGKEYIEALAAFVAEKCTMLGSAGTSKRIFEGKQS